MYLKTDTIILQYTFYQFQYFITTCPCLVEIYQKNFQSNSFNGNDLMVFNWGWSRLINKRPLNKWLRKIERTIITWKKGFSSNLNIEILQLQDYEPAKRALKIFRVINLREYHDLYVQSYTLFLADVLESFQTRCIGILNLGPAHFFSKKDNRAIEYINWHQHLINGRKLYQSRMYHAILRYAETK